MGSHTSVSVCVFLKHSIRTSSAFISATSIRTSSAFISATTWLWSRELWNQLKRSIFSLMCQHQMYYWVQGFCLLFLNAVFSWCEKTGVRVWPEMRHCSEQKNKMQITFSQGHSDWNISVHKLKIREKKMGTKTAIKSNWGGGKGRDKNIFENKCRHKSCMSVVQAVRSKVYKTSMGK